MARDPYEWFTPEPPGKGLTVSHLFLAMALGEAPKKTLAAIRAIGFERIREIPASLVPPLLAVIYEVEPDRRDRIFRKIREAS